MYFIKRFISKMRKSNHFKQAMSYLAVMIVTLLSPSISSAANFTIGNLNYSTESDGSVSVTGATNNKVESISIPSVVTYSGKEYVVRSIKYSAFKNYQNLREVIIEDGKGEMLVKGYKDNMAAMRYPSPFEGCHIDRFYYGRELGTKTINATYYWMKLGAGIKEVEIGNNATQVGQYLVKECVDMEKIIIGVSVVEFREKSFSNATSLREIEFSEGENQIHDISGAEVLADCPLETVIVRRSLGQVAPLAGTSITKAIVTESCECLSYTFVGCTSLNTLVIEDGAKELEFNSPSVFHNCPLENIYMGRNLNDKAAENFHNRSTLKTVTIGDMVTTINGNLFSSCENLDNVTFGKSVSEISSHSFFNCTSLTSIDLPESVTSIGINAFSNCSLLETAVFPPLCDNGYQSVYTDCKSIKKITIPVTVTRLMDTFSRCESLTDIVIEDGTEMLNLEGISVFSSCPIENIYMGRNLNDWAAENFHNRSTLKTVTIGDMVTTINGNLFSSCENLDNVTFGKSVSEISSHSFFNCTSLTSIDLPESVTSIGINAFSNCSLLETAVFPPLCDNGYQSVYTDCKSIKKITIPVTVTRLMDTFSRCESLTDIVIEDGTEMLNLEGISVFSSCPIESIYMGRNLNDWAAENFHNRSTLKTVTIGDMVTSVNQSMFGNCLNLTNLTIGEGVKSIGGYAFGGCEAISDITVKAATPPVCESENVFDGKVYENANLMVPRGTKRVYAKTDVWKNFNKIAPEGNEYTVCVTYNADGGSIMIDGESVASASIEEGERVEIRVTPFEKYLVASAKLNGKDVKSMITDNMLVIEHLSENSSLDVVFEIDPIAGIVNAENDGNVIVNVIDHTINIAGTYSEDTITVCNISGAIVYQGHDKVISLPACGIYIVKVKGNTFKIKI